MSGRRIWLLNAYRSRSHGAWADWLTGAYPDVAWERFELPGRHFRWRIRGNPLSWLDTLPAQPPDRIIATSMVDLATLKGLNPALAAVPVDYYFHENQFAYPVSEQQVRSVEPQMVQIYGALAADRLLFNSAFNRDSFLDGVAELLGRLPDALPDGVVERLRPRSRVLPIPVEKFEPVAQRDRGLIVWNHRWEYDKAPEVFAEALDGLAKAGVDFRLALLGQRPERAPAALRAIRHEHGGRIVADGCLDDTDYRDVVRRAGIVVSTARHEFQGLAMLEAASAGVRPLVPDALCYREQYAELYRYRPGDAGALARRLAAWLGGSLPPRADVTPWTGAALRREWDEIIMS
ncbi:DUF3524 domain-containing protein [Ectothiorhodospiraceae bacterium WFHF3C12]|nr:DUF3524 domain-containing protein [Ectothiorhodospiraceae bacterium WFHF3C12]